MYTQIQPIQGSKCELACRDAKPHEKRPVKRSRSTRYDGARQSSFMPWVWCGSSHNTLVIHWRIDAGREVLSDWEKLYREKYVWFIIAWYPDNWYKVKDNRHICIVEQLEEALNDWRKEE
ncbi:hypothetical protein RRG08_052183 [Elysia crispata]|uniref:Uncharacterized protein n=1 Tax=Elysia crispata TaxID=231223 RepID=A0AAE0YZQ1_9GAST|nr:hypothetical protein RRG08_052183 [Elysia crispata]